ncbi:MAG: methylated-DNA--[protein]-cysteine S-methyltransferase [Erysipelotrichaceae bacterium]
MKQIVFLTPMNKIAIQAQNQKITKVSLNSELDLQDTDDELLQLAKSQFLEYFDKQRQEFSLPYSFTRSEFDTKVYNYLSTIPFGSTISYKDLAIAVNHPKAARAVGRAMNTNELAIIIPCHRVIGSNGKLVGFAGGLALKRQLLNLESNS